MVNGKINLKKIVLNTIFLLSFAGVLYLFFYDFDEADAQAHKYLSGQGGGSGTRNAIIANEYSDSRTDSAKKTRKSKNARSVRIASSQQQVSEPTLTEKIFSAPSAIASAVNFKTGRFKPDTKISVPITGDVRIEFIDSRTICIIGSYAEFLRERYVAECGSFLQGIDSAAANLKEWSRNVFRNVLGAEIILKYRPTIAAAYQSPEKFEFGGGLKTEKSGYWLQPTGQASFPKSRGEGDDYTRNAFVAHCAYFRFSEPMKNGGKYSVKTPFGEYREFEYADIKSISGAIKVNQLGYSPQASRKYAYVGAWLGTLGAADMKLDGAKFFLVNENGNIENYSGTIRRRCDDVAFDGTPFTGETVYELDFSDFNKVGKYHIYIENVGCSYSFEISNSAIGDSFYTHMKGLYHKRCGTPKRAPYTNWTLGACHTSTYRSDFPPNNNHYFRGADDCGFFNESGRRVSVKHFELIYRRRTETPLDISGGWHDAADYDRRPYHYDVVADLLSAYIFRPRNFGDGQLNIPESSNGIADIVDEAEWGMGVWLQAQNRDGSVGGWIEATSHPRDDNPSTDTQRYYLSAATRESTMQYAAHASMLALSFKIAGASAKSKIYLESAKRAFDWAQTASHRFSKEYMYPLSKSDGGDGKTLEKIVYREERDVPAQYSFKAAFNLWKLTGDSIYLEICRSLSDRMPQKFGEMLWRINPLFFGEFAKFGGDVSQLSGTFAKFKKRVVGEADARLAQMEKYQYRIPWFPPSHPYVSKMSWGASHPLVRAKFFMLAYELTEDKKYRDAAYLCNDWHNGANPFGQTMTSGLGKNFPVRFLDNASHVYCGMEYVMGITPYRNTFGIARECVSMSFSLIYPPRDDRKFHPEPVMLMPKSIIGEGGGVSTLSKRISKVWPVWRRYANVEAFSVSASEFTISETMAPAAALTGWLMDGSYYPSQELRDRRPADNLFLLKGFAPLP